MNISELFSGCDSFCFNLQRIKLGAAIEKLRTLLLLCDLSEDHDTIMFP